MTDAEAAKAAHVCRQTVSEWRSDPEFVKALNVEMNRRAADAAQVFRAQASKMTGAAIRAVGAAIEKGDLASARWFLERVNFGAIASVLFEQEANPTLAPEALDAIVEVLAHQHVDAFLAGKGIPAIDRLRIAPALVVREVECLKAEHGNE